MACWDPRTACHRHWHSRNQLTHTNALNNSAESVADNQTPALSNTQWHVECLVMNSEQEVWSTIVWPIRRRQFAWFNWVVFEGLTHRLRPGVLQERRGQGLPCSEQRILTRESGRTVFIEHCLCRAEPWKLSGAKDPKTNSNRVLFCLLKFAETKKISSHDIISHNAIFFKIQHRTNNSESFFFFG